MPDTGVCDTKRKICSDANAVMEKITTVQSMLRLYLLPFVYWKPPKAG